MRGAKMSLLYWMSLTMFFITAECAKSFCGDCEFHRDLSKATVRLSDWLREYYRGNFTPCEPHIASSMVVSRRLAGHHPKTLLTDAKFNDSLTVVNLLKTYLNKHQKEYRNLSRVPAGQMAFILQGIMAICLNPQNFFGHNLTKALADKFKSFTVPPNNYFQYSAIVLALCHSGVTNNQEWKNRVVKIILKLKQKSKRFAQRTFPDTSAMAVMALSCLRRNLVNKTKVDNILTTLINGMTSDGRPRWNVHSTSLILQALMTAPSHLKPKHYRWKKVIKGILKEQDNTGSFGNVLANIHILPALAGTSLATLHDLPCSVELEVPRKKNISVCVKLERQDSNGCMISMASPVNLTVPEKTTAAKILKLAKKKNPKFKHEVKKFSYGQMITAISNVKENRITGFHWMLYSDNNSLALDGIDAFTPNNNTCIIFKHKKFGVKKKNCNIES